MARKHIGFTDRVMTFLRENPDRWIEASRFEDVGGRQAWRTRIAEARIRFEIAGEGTILNDVRTQKDGKGRRWTLSQYMFERWTPKVAEAPREAAHDVNAWSLRP